MDKRKITIDRSSSLVGCAKAYNVEIDGISVGKLKNGGTINTYVAVGTHSLSFLYLGRAEKTISILVESECTEQRLFVSLDMRGKPVLTSDSSLATSGGPAYSPAPTKQKKRHPFLLTVGILFCALIVIGVIGSIGGNAPSDSPPANSLPVELTDEEKAVAKLEEATAEFNDGDYISAIGICDKIAADYPTTETSANMSAYLDTQYLMFASFSATDLMREYDANVVNADEEYTGTTMIVTGTVSSIGKTNNDRNLIVLLSSGTYFHGVQLNFNTSQTAKIALLHEGDTVSAIGKCTGKSGKQLIVLDGNNVMIEDCLLITG